jgi:hypothetical protein
MSKHVRAKASFRALLGAGAFCACSLAASQTFTSDTQLLVAPEASANVVAAALGGAVLKIRKRQGFWLEVEAAGSLGWVKISAVKWAAPNVSAGVDTGRLGTNNIVASSSARSLSARDLLEGRNDEQAIERLSALRLQPQQISQFAQEGGLVAVTLMVSLRAPVQGNSGATSPPDGAQASPFRPRSRQLRKDSDAGL